MELGLKDVHVLVTGASGGIGLETVRLYLNQGAKVTAHYNTTSSTLDPLIAEFGADRIRTAQANLGVEADVLRMFASEHAFGAISIAVINHGIWLPEDVLMKDMTLERWNKTITTNLTSSFLVARGYMKQLESASNLVKDSASIVFIGSCAGKYGEAYHSDYAATKSALMYGLTTSLKNEIVKFAPKARVNTIAPGWVLTPMATETLSDPEVVKTALATSALRKFALPYDIATQIVFMSSPIASGHVTGEVVMLTGGLEGRLLNPL